MTRSNSNYSQMASGLRELVGAEVLVIDKDESVHQGMTQLLASARLHVTCAATPNDAYSHMRRKFFSVVVVDLDTPTPAAGLDTCRTVKELSPTSMVVMLTPRKSFDDAVESIRAGAVDVVWKSPESVAYLRDRVMAAAGRSVGKREVNSILTDVRETYDDFLKRFMDAERRAMDGASGVNPLSSRDELRVLIVAPDSSLKDALIRSQAKGFEFASAASGGEGLDRCSSSRFHIAMVCEHLPDLPGSMVVKSIKTQSPETVVLQYTPPPGGRVELVESRRRVDVVSEFNDPSQLIERLDELAEAFHVKSRERKYTQAFREKHYDFLRRYVQLKLKIDRAIGESGSDKG